MHFYAYTNNAIGDKQSNNWKYRYSSTICLLTLTLLLDSILALEFMCQ